MRFLFFLAVLGIFMGCNSQKVYQVNPEDYVSTEFRQLDTLYVTAASADDVVPQNTQRYNPSFERTFDLLHTRLRLSFDWPKEQVIGQAELQLTPVFYDSDEVLLDAKGFQINAINKKGSSQALTYDYDDKHLRIKLDRTYTRKDTLWLAIDYIATPRAEGGSSAITSDKGLFFINPRKEEGEKPQQIWTQGETEHNSNWFPTIDKPNERCTQEIYLTVEDRFTTLSNGLLKSSTKNGDGTRTDYWTQSLPHAPYLFMLAIGEYAKVDDEWNGIPVSYYVEPDYEEHADDIFMHTPEMLTFFSEKLGLAYPWEKYSQVVVRDYVSGAMENTTAVIYGEFVQRTDRELIDDTNERICAHEMIHHWFGDYVTCESWANLTMNEGFANYGEYLWFEHQYGIDRADAHMLDEREGYFSSYQQLGGHPLIHFGYDDKEDMFDAHSYNKGGCALHMLRNYIGDEAFFAALNRYLTENAYTAVEAHDLRLAVEDITGQDWNWFFNQWFFSSGHPTLEVEKVYDEDNKTLYLDVRQYQGGEQVPNVFVLPVRVDIYMADGSVLQKDIRLEQREQSFSLPMPERPRAVVFDAADIVLGEWDESYTDAEAKFLLQQKTKLRVRLAALNQLINSEDNYELDIASALSDPYFGMRQTALGNLDAASIADREAAIVKMATEDPHSAVRMTALDRLLEIESPKMAELSKQVLAKEKAYPPLSVALVYLFENDRPAAMAAAKNLEDANNEEIASIISAMYSETGDLKYLSYFHRQLERIEGFAAINLYSAYANLLLQHPPASTPGAIDRLARISQNQQQNPWQRLSATKALNDLRNAYYQISQANSDGAVYLEASKKAHAAAEKAIELETNDEIKMLYGQMKYEGE